MAASLVLAHLDSGRLVGLERSPKMLAAATQRNAADVRAGRGEFVTGRVAEATFGARRFDRIFAARVVAMTRPDGLAWAAGLLAPQGTLTLAFDAPEDALTCAGAKAAIVNLPTGGLRLAAVTDAHLDGMLVICVQAVRDCSVPSGFG